MVATTFGCNHFTFTNSYIFKSLFYYDFCKGFLYLKLLAIPTGYTNHNSHTYYSLEKIIQLVLAD